MNNPKWLEVAMDELGQKEILGRADNPKIKEYHQSVQDLDLSDSVPWCSSFINWVFEQCDMKGTESTMSRSWLNWGQKLKKPVKGCVVITRRGGNSWQGHVGLFIEENQGRVKILGGNQSDSVSIASFPKSHVLGYRWPSDIEIPKEES